MQNIGCYKSVLKSIMQEFAPQGARKRTKETQSQQKKEKNNDQNRDNKNREQKTIKRISDIKNWCLKRYNKIDKPLATQTKNTPISNIRKSEDITTNLTEIKRLERECSEQLYANQLDNLDEVGKFPETQNCQNSRKKQKM